MKDKYIYIGFACIIAYMLPYLILGENAYITIHDFLDQNVAIMADLKNNGILTGLSGVMPVMGGLNRSLFPVFTPFDIKMVSYALLPTFWAIVCYTFVFKIVAFLGMFLFLDDYVFKGERKWMSLLLSIGFAFMPFYMELSVSGAGFPLLAWAFLNLYKKKFKLWSYVVIAFYTFNSWLAYGGFFFLVVLGCFLIYDFNRTKKFSKDVIYGATFMCVVYAISNWGTFYSIFFSDSFVSHRTEWINSATLISSLVYFFKILAFSQYHAGSFLAAPILIAFIIVLFIYRIRYPIVKYAAILYGVVAAGILVGSLLKLVGMQLFVTVQFDRFYFFYPSVTIILLATICYVLIKENKMKLAVLSAFYGLICGICFDGECINNVKLLVGREISKPSFKHFYDTDLFSMIHAELNTKPNYKTKTVSLGIYPCVPEYNGFYTLDAYRVNYPLEYKNEFREVIAGELDKNETLRKYYDEWGSRCYVFSAELFIQENLNQFLCSKQDDISVNNLDINTKALKDLGCEYILSAVDIVNYQDLNLVYVNSYTTDQSYWNIRVYKLN